MTEVEKNVNDLEPAEIINQVAERAGINLPEAKMRTIIKEIKLTLSSQQPQKEIKWFGE